MNEKNLGHEYDISINVSDSVELVERSVFFGQPDDGGFDCAGTVGTFGSAGGCFGTAGTFGCCC